MSNFVDDETSLPYPKATLRTRPVGSDANKYLSASDWNALCQAAVDLRGAILDIRDGGAGGGGNLESVRAHGANGTGEVDDSAAINAAITAALAAGKDVFFPPGTYKITSTINVTGHDLTILGRQAIIKYESATRIGFNIADGSYRVIFSNLTFQGDNNDDKLVNFYGAIQMNDGSTDVVVTDCRFEQCVPFNTIDSHDSARLYFTRNYIHNAPQGIHPPTDAIIENCHFICDESVSSRGQAIYSFGQQVNLTVKNCHFKNINEEDIQIRASFPRFNQRDNFRIEGCMFENSNQYSIWVGSDEKPDIGAGVIITNNSFKNCSSPIHCFGARSVVITDNHLEWDFEWPYGWAELSAPPGIYVASGVGLSGRFAVSRGAVIANNKLIHRHPFLGKITITALPVDGDTITIGEFTYTWRNTATVEGDVEIGAELRTCAANLTAVIRGADGLMTAPNNALRYLTDTFSNQFGAIYGETNFNVVYVASWYAYPLSVSHVVSPPGTRVTVDAPVDTRGTAGAPIQVENAITPLIEGNVCDDFMNGITISGCYQPTVRNNVNTDHTGLVPIILANGNVLSSYSGNRRISQNLPVAGRPYYGQISDAFPVIEDSILMLQDYMNEEMQGRSGTATIGDGKAYTWLYYGQELSDLTSPATRPFRWDDGDFVELWNGSAWTTFRFKRTSPGAGQFNSADSLITLINATGTWTAAYASYTNNLGISNPKLLIKVKAVSGGTTGNNFRLWPTRCKTPADTSTYLTVPQPLTVAVVLRDRTPGVDELWSRFYGGAASLTKTFVFTPIVNATRGVTVSGVDATSHALDPVVYSADIVMGVGFYITHAAGTGTEKFFWRVN